MSRPVPKTLCRDCGRPVSAWRSTRCRACYAAANAAGLFAVKPKSPPVQTIEPFGEIRVPEGVSVTYVRRGAAKSNEGNQ